LSINELILEIHSQYSQYKIPTHLATVNTSKGWQ